MIISPIDVAAANFRTDEKSDELNTKFMERLGMKKRFLPARLAISRSLASTSPLEAIEAGTLTGKSIKGDTLFGTGTSLFVWLSLIIERSEDKDLDTKKLISLVGSHWQRGIKILDKRWEDSNHDITQFLKKLISEADIPMKSTSNTDSIGTSISVIGVSGLIEVPIGEVSEDADTGEQVSWELNGPGGSPHCAIMGGVGSGKTKSAVAMLKSIREQAKIPLLAFDFKGDLGTDKNGGGYHLDEEFSAEVIEPPRTPIPLDVLALYERDEYSITEAASHFRDSFTRLKTGKLGAIQKTALHDAASNALQKNKVCRLSDIKEELIKIYEDKEIKHDGAISSIEEICRHSLFEPELSPSEFFQKNWIIKIPPNVPEDSRTIVVNLVLNAFDQYLNSLIDSDINSDGARSLRNICMIDEAHQILKSKLPSLSRLIRMSRSKGGAIMLISQSPDDFTGEDDEFLSEMGLVVAFSTNAPPKNASRILGRGIKLGNLETGQCFIKKRGDQFSRLIRSWSVNS